MPRNFQGEPPLVNYPYVYSAPALKRFLKLIPETAPPTEVTPEYLLSAGFRNNNDRAIIPTLKFIGLLKEDGTPSDDYALLRDKSQAGIVMATHLRSAYNELFALYPDAQNKSSEALKNFFAPKTKAGAAALGMIVATFKTLCESADFGTTPVSSPAGQPASQARVFSQTTQSPESGVTVNLNIQLQLPPTENAEIYDKIFESLRKHLIERKPPAGA